MAHCTRKWGIGVTSKIFRSRSKMSWYYWMDVWGRWESQGGCPGFYLRTGGIDGGAITEVGNGVRSGRRRLGEKKRNSILDMSSCCGTYKWNSLLFSGNWSSRGWFTWPWGLCRVRTEELSSNSSLIIDGEGKSGQVGSRKLWKASTEKGRVWVTVPNVVKISRKIEKSLLNLANRMSLLTLARAVSVGR